MKNREADQAMGAQPSLRHEAEQAKAVQKKAYVKPEIRRYQLPTITTYGSFMWD